MRNLHSLSFDFCVDIIKTVTGRKQNELVDLSTYILCISVIIIQTGYPTNKQTKYMKVNIQRKKISMGTQLVRLVC